MIESILLADRDDTTIPAKRVLRIYGHPPHHGLGEMVTFQPCEQSEDADGSNLEFLASFGVDLEVLVDAINLTLGRKALEVRP